MRTDSARETEAFALSTYSCTKSRTAGSFAASANGRSAGRPCAGSHAASPSGSSVISAAMNGRPSPTTTACSTIGQSIIVCSIGIGDTFLPPAVMMMSFLRPVIVMRPSSSIDPRSPVLNQPSSVNTSAVLSGRLW